MADAATGGYRRALVPREARRVIAFVLGFCAGAAVLQTQAVLPPLAVSGLATLLGGAIALALGLPMRRRDARPVACLALAAALAASGAASGWFWAAWRAGTRLASTLDAAWEGRDLVVTGVVADLPRRFDRGTRFTLAVDQAEPVAAQVPAQVSVAWYRSGRPDPGAATGLPELRPGERWRLAVRLRRPHGLANPHGFDYEAWLLEHGIRATGYVLPRGEAVRLDPLVHRPAWWIQRARFAIRQRMERVLAQARYGGVLAALAVGDQRAIPAEQWHVFTRTGVNHLMSISGLHVTMIGSLLALLCGALWRRSARLCLWLPARRAAAGAGLAGALAYAALSGFALPAQRTVYMLAVFAAALWVGREVAFSRVLAVALLLVVLVDPWAALAPGFWLSFGAVTVILLVTTGRTLQPSGLVTWARVQWAITLGLVPAMLAMFQQVSLVSPLANALAIPLVSFLVTPLALAGAALPLDFLLHVSHGAMSLTMALLEPLASLPDAVWEQHAPPAAALVIALPGILWLLLPAGIPARWVGAVALLPLFLLAPAPPPPGSARLAVLDVGQGLAVVVQTHRHALLYDAGPAWSPEADAGARVIVPYLRASGVRRLDALVITHADVDHAGGVGAVLAAVPTERVLSSLETARLPAAVKDSHTKCAHGQAWTWDGVRFEMLHPLATSHADPRIRTNDRSCVMRIRAAGRAVLLTGDIEARSERELLARDAAALRADVLLVPHHGSRTSSTAAFLDAVSAAVSVFTVGYRNRFGHPRADVLARHVARGARSFRSDRDGAVLIELGPAGWTARAYREGRRRYWEARTFEAAPPACEDSARTGPCRKQPTR